ncbi:MAG: D-alanine--D-alanine ligase [Chlamydiota bacterium]
MKKLRVGILFGGKSCEHEVSLLSAKNVIDALDKEKYEPVLIGIDKAGTWHIKDPLEYLMHAHDPNRIQLHGPSNNVAIATEEGSGSFLHTTSTSSTSVDVIFPVLHGSYGEDGTIQGLLKIANIPFVGADVLGSAIGMDKDVVKRLLKESGIDTAKGIVLRSFEKDLFSYEEVVNKIGLPFFVKPANAGSSVGVTKVKKEEDFTLAVTEAFLYDKKILLEEYIEGREIECSVLGNDHPIASLPGEIIPHHEFYSYEAKYLDDNGATLEIPAKLDPAILKNVQETAVLVFQVLCCEGMARVDFFLQKSGRLVVNEINTIPGFTKISMYPKLWQISGLSYADLLDRLIHLALERHGKELQIQTQYQSIKTL